MTEEMEVEEVAVPLAVDLDMNLAKQAGVGEIAFAVATFYSLQEERKRAALRAAALDKDGRPSHLAKHLLSHFAASERHVDGIIRVWAREHVECEWAMKVLGIGHRLAAGLAAHVDMAKCPHVSSLWRFAGLDPTSKWEKGKKRPFNAELKVLCWKIGESFKKVSGREASLYGLLYRERKVREVAKSAAGDFKDQAAAMLAAKNFSRDTTAKACYSKGELPPAHLDRRAARYATKVFLSHYWEARWRLLNPGKTPESPWILAHGGHTDRIAPEVPFE